MGNKSNIDLGSVTLHIKGPDEVVPIHEVLSVSLDKAFEEVFSDYQTPEPLDVGKYVKIPTAKEATFEFKLEPSPDWVLVNCMHCHQPLPVTRLYATVFGKDFWRCPKCAAIVRDRR